MKYSIAFVCVHNSCRSQMAEALANTLGKDVLCAYSAGTEEYPKVKEKAVMVMEEEGISMEGYYPKLLGTLPSHLDYVIKMGCEVACPAVLGDTIMDWGIEDPSGGSLDDFRKARDQIKAKLIDLLQDIEKE